MGMYNSAAEPISGSLGPIGEARKYTMYTREAGVWYVNYRANGRQVRRSTGMTDEASARATVESMFGGSPRCVPTLGVNRKHVRKMLARAAHRAKAKNIPYALKIEDVTRVVDRSKGCCEVSGIAFEDTGPFKPSLDRIVPELGYIPGNIRVVCLVTNTAMLHYGEECLFKLAIAICRNRNLI